MARDLTIAFYASGYVTIVTTTSELVCESERARKREKYAHMSVEGYSKVGTKISLAGLYNGYDLCESFVQSSIHLHHHLVRIAIGHTECKYKGQSTVYL